MTSQTRSNAEVARAFDMLADYLELAGENPYKVRAYRTAADALEALREPVSVIAAEGRLGTLPGFGDAIRAKTIDILATGTTAAIEKMRAAIPESALELLKLPGLGPKTIYQLYTGAGAASVEALEEAARSGRLRDIKGMGAKMEEKVLDSIERYRRYAGTMLISEGLRIATGLVDLIGQFPGVVRANYAGSVRRGVETVGNVNLTAAVSSSPETVLDRFCSLAQIDRVLARDARHADVLLSGGVAADIYLSPPESYGALLQYRTGSKAHNFKLGALAKIRGLELANGILTRDGEPVAETIATDDDVYRVLGIPPIPAPLREDRGEIEAAIAGTLPALIETSDIRGNLHTHTTASDGTLTLPQMAAAARELGYEYLAITDHTHSLAIANGLTPERVRDQIRAVREAEQSAGIRLLTGTECDIRQDGSMDLPDDLLADLDFVVASIHGRFKMTREEMTERIISAVRNPHVDLIGHPTGRLINSREAYEVDMNRLIAESARRGVALEINASPERQDLSDVNARKAREGGVKIVISSDAHSRSDLDLMPYGVRVAQRAWCTAGDVWNAQPLSSVEAWLSSRGK